MKGRNREKKDQRLPEQAAQMFITLPGTLQPNGCTIVIEK